MSDTTVRTIEVNYSDPKWSDFSYMKTMTCANHLGARYLSKGPGRSLFCIRADEDVLAAHLNMAREQVTDNICRMHCHIECECPMSEMLDVVTADPECEHRGVFANSDGFDVWCGYCQSYVPNCDL